MNIGYPNIVTITLHLASRYQGSGVEGDLDLKISESRTGGVGDLHFFAIHPVLVPPCGLNHYCSFGEEVQNAHQDDQCAEDKQKCSDGESVGWLEAAESMDKSSAPCGLSQGSDPV